MLLPLPARAGPGSLPTASSEFSSVWCRLVLRAQAEARLVPAPSGKLEPGVEGLLECRLCPVGGAAGGCGRPIGAAWRVWIGSLLRRTVHQSFLGPPPQTLEIELRTCPAGALSLRCILGS